jgi:hypothetical protein
MPVAVCYQDAKHLLSANLLQARTTSFDTSLAVLQNDIRFFHGRIEYPKDSSGGQTDTLIEHQFSHSALLRLAAVFEDLKVSTSIQIMCLALVSMAIAYNAIVQSLLHKESG